MGHGRPDKLPVLQKIAGGKLPMSLGIRPYDQIGGLRVRMWPWRFSKKNGGHVRTQRNCINIQAIDPTLVAGKEKIQCWSSHCLS